MPNKGRGKSRRILGYVLCALAALGIIASFGADGQGLKGVFTSIAVFLSPGVAIILIDREKSAAMHRAAQYVDLVQNQNYRSIDNIASAIGRSDVGAVAGELQQATQLGLLPGISLDLRNRILTETPVARQAASAGTRYAFSCAVCGAPNDIVAQPGAVACEFLQRTLYTSRASAFRGAGPGCGRPAALRRPD